MPKVMPIYGTRPEAIKVAPIVKALEASDQFDCVVAVTGQHREMLTQVMSLFDLEADHDLPLAGFALNTIIAHVTTKPLVAR